MKKSLPEKKIRLLVVDDLGTMRAAAQLIFQSDPAFEVIGFAANGAEAILRTQELAPDVVLMDIMMPEMDGVEATREIMKRQPTPIVLFTANDNELFSFTFEGLGAGAVAIFKKDLDRPDQIVRLIETVKDAAKSVLNQSYRNPASLLNPVASSEAVSVPIVAVGSSAGGPAVLLELLSQLPADFPAAIIVTQHMSPGFMDGLVSWLDSQVALTVQLAKHNHQVQSSHVYLAPDGFQTTVEGTCRYRLIVNNTTAYQNYCPAVNVTLGSVAKFAGRRALGVILTGMGSDGAEGIKAMKDAGAHTITQDKESSLVYGMPGAALAAGGISQVVSLDQMAAHLVLKVNGLMQS